LIQSADKRLLDLLELLLGALLTVERNKTPGRAPLPAIAEVGSGDDSGKQ
jgi:hypothetical protein